MPDPAAQMPSEEAIGAGRGVVTVTLPGCDSTSTSTSSTPLSGPLPVLNTEKCISACSQLSMNGSRSPFKVTRLTELGSNPKLAPPAGVIDVQALAGPMQLAPAPTGITV